MKHPFTRTLVTYIALVLIASVIACTPRRPSEKGALVEGIVTRDIAKVKRAIRAGADVNATNRFGQTPIMYAAERGDSDVVRLLLAKGARTDVYDAVFGGTPITLATDRGYTEVVRLFVRNGTGFAKEDEGGARAMKRAKKNGYTEIIALLQEASERER